MKTKRTPATPLPWHLDCKELYGFDVSMIVDFGTHDYETQDAA